MNNSLEQTTVAGSDKFPQIDMAYDQGKGYAPESELMRAIILRAIEDLKYGSGEVYDDAYAFFEDEDEDYVFAFKSICRYLGLDPQATRASIMMAIKVGRRISTRRRAA